MSKHKHSVAVQTTKPGTGIYRQRCTCGATRTADYRGLVGEMVEPKVSSWKKAKKR